MKCSHRLAFILTSLVGTACDQADKPTPAPAPTPAEYSETAPSPPTMPNQTFTVSGQDISYLNGQGHLRIPDGWRQVTNSDYPVEIEAERYLADGDNWAMCHLIELSAPNFAFVSQDSINRYVESLWHSVTGDLEADGIQVEVTYPTIGANVRAKSITYSSDYVDVIAYAMFVVDRAVVHGTYINCDTSSPASEEDRKDIAGFVESFRFNAR